MAGNSTLLTLGHIIQWCACLYYQMAVASISVWQEIGMQRPAAPARTDTTLAKGTVGHLRHCEQCCFQRRQWKLELYMALQVDGTVVVSSHQESDGSCLARHLID